jgi:hypothetical protein
MARYSIDDNVLNALIKQESGGNPKAVSKKGARGITQIMPETGKKPGYNVKPLQNDSEEEAIRFTRDYMGALLEKNGGDLNKALAAYNAGQGNVDKYGGVPPFKETQSYVKNIMNTLNPMGSAQAGEVSNLPPGFVLDNNEQVNLPDGFVLDDDTSQGTPYHGRNVEDMGATGQFLTGVGNKAIDLARGAAQITGIQPGGFGGEQDISESKQLNEALGKTGAGTAGKIAGDVLPFMMTGGGSTVPSLVAKSAAMSALEPTSGNDSRAKNIALGAAGGAVGGVIGKGIGKVIGGFKPSQDAAALMKQGIQPTLGQGIDKTGMIGKGISKAEEATTSLPFLGGITRNARDRALKEGMKTAISKAEDKTLNVSAKGAVGHEAITNLKESFNGAYSKAMDGHKLALKPELTQKIVDAVKDQSKFVNEAERKSIFTGLQGLFDKIKPDANGKYLASDIHQIESALKTQARGLPFGDDKAKILSEVQREIAKYRTANLPPEVGEVIKKLDSKYLNFVRLRRAAEGVGAEHGEFSPAQLYNAATMLGKKSGQSSMGKAPMQELAGQMKSTLSDKLGDSGTAPRMLTNKLLAGGALEAGLGGFNLPAYLGLGATMGVGSTRVAQKALLGGVKGQKELAKAIGKNKLTAALGYSIGKQQ